MNTSISPSFLKLRQGRYRIFLLLIIVFIGINGFQDNNAIVAAKMNLSLIGKNQTIGNSQKSRKHLSIMKSGLGKVWSIDINKKLYVPGINCGNDCGNDYDSGSTVTLLAHAGSGYKLTGWSSDCKKTQSDTNNSFCVVSMDRSKIIKATFHVLTPAIKKISTENTNQSAPLTHPLPVITLYPLPEKIRYGGTSKIIWLTQNADSCTLSSILVGSSGSYITTILTNTTQYNLVCTGKGGISKEVTTVEVLPSSSTGSEDLW